MLIKFSCFALALLTTSSFALPTISLNELPFAFEKLAPQAHINWPEFSGMPHGSPFLLVPGFSSLELGQQIKVLRRVGGTFSVSVEDQHRVFQILSAHQKITLGRLRDAKLYPVPTKGDWQKQMVQTSPWLPTYTVHFLSLAEEASSPREHRLLGALSASQEQFVRDTYFLSLAIGKPLDLENLPTPLKSRLRAEHQLLGIRLAEDAFGHISPIGQLNLAEVFSDQLFAELPLKLSTAESIDERWRKVQGTPYALEWICLEILALQKQLSETRIARLNASEIRQLSEQVALLSHLMSEMEPLGPLKAPTRRLLIQAQRALAALLALRI